MLKQEPLVVADAFVRIQDPQPTVLQSSLVSILRDIKSRKTQLLRELEKIKVVIEVIKRSYA